MEKYLIELVLHRKHLDKGAANYQTVLQATIEKDNVELMKELLIEFGDVNQHLSSGKTILQIAVEKSAVKCVHHLLQLKADPNKWDAAQKCTAVHAVAVTTSQSAEILQLLVDYGGNINNGVDRSGDSVLHHAVKENNVNMVKYLLDNKVETVVRTFHETALHTAAENDFHVIAEMLLKDNRGCVDSLRGDKVRETALHIVADAGFVNTCQVLLR